MSENWVAAAQPAEQVDLSDFFTHRRYALVEIDPAAGYGKTVFEKLRAGGRDVCLVMRQPSAAAKAVVGQAYESLEHVSQPLDGVLFNIEDDPERLLHETRIAVEKGVPRIWIENRCNPGTAVDCALAHGVQVIVNACSLLALDPTGIHKLHRRILDVFGKAPRPAVRKGPDQP